MVGVAREVATLLGGELHLPAQDDAPIVDSEDVDVTVEDFEGCPRYIGRVFRDVRIGPSPQWLRTRLHLAEMRSISNVVDVTNYVMHVWRSPLHAFDRAKLAGGRIVVRRARPGEELRTLDGTLRALARSDLLITDGERRSRWRRSWAARTARSPLRRARCSSRRRTSSRSGSSARRSGSRCGRRVRIAGKKASTRTRPRTRPSWPVGSSSTWPGRA